VGVERKGKEEKERLFGCRENEWKVIWRFLVDWIDVTKKQM